MGMPSRRTNNFPESGRGLGHVTLQFVAVRSAILATAWLLVLQANQKCEVVQFSLGHAVERQSNSELFVSVSYVLGLRSS